MVQSANAKRKKIFFLLDIDASLFPQKKNSPPLFFLQKCSIFFGLFSLEGQKEEVVGLYSSLFVPPLFLLLLRVRRWRRSCQEQEQTLFKGLRSTQDYQIWARANKKKPLSQFIKPTCIATQTASFSQKWHQQPSQLIDLLSLRKKGRRLGGEKRKKRLQGLNLSAGGGEENLRKGCMPIFGPSFSLPA